MNKVLPPNLLKPYSSYKPSGIDWLGEVPEHWDVEKLKYPAPLINEKIEAELNPFPYIGLEHIQSWTGEMVVGEGLQDSSEGLTNRFNDGDVLFGKLRPYLAKVFRAKSSGVCSGEFLVLRPDTCTQDYLFYYLIRSEFISVVDSSTYGAKMPRASWEFIGQLPIILPPLPEQQAIADFLDRQTAKIDTLIAKKEDLIALLKEKRQAMITQAVTKGLDPTVPMKDSGVKWLGEVPEGWNTRQLKYVAKFQRGHDLPEANREEGPIPVVSSGGTTGSHNESRAKGPGIVTGRYGTIGMFYFVEGDFWPLNTTLYCVMMWGNHPRFLWYLLQNISSLFLVNSKKSAVPGVDRNDMHPVLVVLPPTIQMQKDIAVFLDRETATIDALIVKVEEAMEKLKEYRTALITAAVTGKIDVRGEG